MTDRPSPTTPALRSAYPTVLVTLVLGLVGLWPMHRQTRNAAARGIETDRYWRAFLVAVGINLLVVAGLVLTLVLVLRHYLG